MGWLCFYIRTSSKPLIPEWAELLRAGIKARVSLKFVQKLGCPLRFFVLCFEHAG